MANGNGNRDIFSLIGEAFLQEAASQARGEAQEVPDDEETEEGAREQRAGPMPPPLLSFLSRGPEDVFSRLSSNRGSFMDFGEALGNEDFREVFMRTDEASTAADSVIERQAREQGGLQNLFGAIDAMNEAGPRGSSILEGPAAARDAASAPGGGQGGGFGAFQELLRTAQARNEQMKQGVQGGPGILSLLLPSPAGPAAGASRVGQGVMRMPRGPTPRDLERAGRFSNIDEILRISQAEKIGERMRGLSRILGGGPVGTGARVEKGILADQILPLGFEMGLRARRGDVMDDVIVEHLLQSFRNAKGLLE